MTSNKGKRVNKNAFNKIVGAGLAAIGLMLVPAAGVNAEEKAAGPFVTEDGARTKAPGAIFEDGKWVIEETGEPTYHVQKDGKLDFLSFRGFQRYHAECHVCHGPEGMGSTYAPALIDSMKTMSYGDFVAVVASGRVVHQPGGGESVMPALGDNKNVMCYLDGMYNYLKGRADGVIPRGRPPGKEDKPAEIGEAENACLDS